MVWISLFLYSKRGAYLKCSMMGGMYLSLDGAKALAGAGRKIGMLRF